MTIPTKGMGVGSNTHPVPYRGGARPVSVVLALAGVLHRHSIPRWPLRAGVHRMLDLGHLGDQVGGVDQAAASWPVMTMLVTRPAGQRRDHLIGGDPAPLEWVGELVEDIEVMTLLKGSGG